MCEIVPAETHSAVFPFQNLDSLALQLSVFSGIDFLSIHSYNVQSADSQAIQAGAFSQMRFLEWDFHALRVDILNDVCNNE